MGVIFLYVLCIHVIVSESCLEEKLFLPPYLKFKEFLSLMFRLINSVYKSATEMG
jgi:hypothetical protein